MYQQKIHICNLQYLQVVKKCEVVTIKVISVYVMRFFQFTVNSIEMGLFVPGFFFQSIANT